MDNLVSLIETIAETIEENRKHALGCIGVRPSQIIKNKSPIFYTVVTYIFNILIQNGLVRKHTQHKKVKYLICRDSELYRMSKTELICKIMCLVEKYEQEKKQN